MSSLEADLAFVHHLLTRGVAHDFSAPLLDGICGIADVCSTIA